MDWLKRKKAAAAAAASQATAKLKNKRTAFKGEGNVLGAGTSESSAGATSAAAAPPQRASRNPFHQEKPPVISDEEKARRREMQTKAAESRAGAWDRRVHTSRQARLQQEERQATRFETPPSAPSTDGNAGVMPPAAPTVVLSDAAVKAREVEMAQAQLGFNPFAVTFSSSTEASAAINPMAPRDVSVNTMAASAGNAMPVAMAAADAYDAPAEEGHAIYILLTQEPPRAILAIETILKMLRNILANPQEEKFRRVRVSNPAIQSKLVAVDGAVELLVEAGFVPVTIDEEDLLVMTDQQIAVARIKTAMADAESALAQLKAAPSTS